MAWRCAYRSELRSYSVIIREDGQVDSWWPEDPRVAVHRDHLTWPSGAPADWPAPSQVFEAAGIGLRVRQFLDAVINPLLFTGDFPIDTTYPYGINRLMRAEEHAVEQVTCGWPLPALTYEQFDESNSAHGDKLWPVRRGPAIDLGEGKRWPIVPVGCMPSRAALPVTPLWLGFLGNTVLFSVGAWLLGEGAMYAVRRVLWIMRHRRNCCTGCGYSRANLPTAARCPECGRGRNDSRASIVFRVSSSDP